MSASKPEAGPRRSARQLAERVAECRTKVALLDREFQEHVTDTGEIVPQLQRTEWRGTERLPFDEAVDAIAAGQGFKLVLGGSLSIRIVSTAGVAGFSNLRAWAEEEDWGKRADELKQANPAQPVGRVRKIICRSHLRGSYASGQTETYVKFRAFFSRASNSARLLSASAGLA